ncbi:ABC-three component system middle component 6 [Anaeromicropila herbilytica]|uniref:Uncharacterized protein n=1 Tax=Anaeromicropila herbilytica TaxID=2785025 RepID=A0A7R7EIV7_9FIRM|nr:ABC-three component system middle component 6 [Anaeromicropila herbilytica]BCN29559.1 hypothetical protein bsdtb5_08540 [Anaeromicropila herbilytica]
MLLPDNIQPELCIYYNGALVLEELQNNSVQLIIDLYQSVKEKHDMSFSIFTLSLDWLYLIDVAKFNEKGEIELCS